MKRIPAAEMEAQFERVLLGKGFTPELAAINARLFTQNGIDGIYTHGLNRFPRTIEYIDRGWITVNAVAGRVGGAGALEQWDGNRGMGPSNASLCMDRAVKLAREYGIGVVALRGTTHWMRGGAYGLQAADAGCIGICFTNTIPNMPPWGAMENRVGNNPFIIALPRKAGHVMLDMAMSQFSFGAIEKLAKEGRTLPVPGGFDARGEITTDPAAVWETQRPLPIGFWKGSGLSVVLDMMASVLAQGNSVRDLSELPAEFDICQVFIAIDAQGRVGETMAQQIESTIQYIKEAEKVPGTEEILYPNEMSYAVRADNLAHGIPVDEEYWNTVLQM